MNHLKRKPLTHAEEILQAVAALVQQGGKHVFTRDEVRRQLGIDRDRWMSGYTAVFQGMRADEPGGAPRVKAGLKGVFRRVERGKYILTEYGKQLLRKLNPAIPVETEPGGQSIGILYSANRPSRTLTLHKDSCHHIPWDKLDRCGCGSVGKLGNQRWWCSEHIAIEIVNAFMNRRQWAILLCHTCYE